MASKSGNDVVAALQARQKAQVAAARGFTVAQAAVEAAQRRRAALLAEQDAVVGEARRESDVALAVLATVLLQDEQTAEMVDVPVATVRNVRRNADPGEVARRIEALGVRRRRQRRDEPATPAYLDAVKAAGSVLPAPVSGPGVG